MSDETTETSAEPTAPPEPQWKTCKTHDVKWDESTQQGALEKLNHNEVYGCEVVDGEHTTEDEENAKDQDTAAEVAPDVEEKPKGSKSAYGSSSKS